MNIHPVNKEKVKFDEILFETNQQTRLFILEFKRKINEPIRAELLIRMHSNTPVLILQVLVQLKLVVDGARSPDKLLVLPGIGRGDAIGPHAEERDGTCRDEDAVKNLTKRT